MHSSGVECSIGLATCLSEHSCCTELILPTSSDEHLIQLTPHSEYLWRFWEVWSTILDALGSTLTTPHNSITKDRTEVVIEGTYNFTTGEEGLVHWQEIEFNCKPGGTSRQPCFISPYHYRIDWLLWFAAFQV